MVNTYSISAACGDPKVFRPMPFIASGMGTVRSNSYRYTGTPVLACTSIHFHVP